jgi:RNA polymerase sigma-70 factor (ECF subfamily)
LAKGLLGDQAEAEDVVHDVFVAFARSAGQFRLTGSLRGYLATCVSNRARDKIRARIRRADAQSPETPRVSDIDNPARRAIEAEELTRLRQALHRIPFEQREAILLHLRGGLKFREIAKRQGVSIGTLHGRYRYGLNKLRSLLNNEVKE